MDYVYMVYTIYQYDGYDNAEIYRTREQAINAANQLLFEFQEDGYEINPDYTDGYETFDCFVEDTTLYYIRLSNKDGDVEITIEEKLLR